MGKPSSPGEFGQISVYIRQKISEELASTKALIEVIASGKSQTKVEVRSLQNFTKRPARKLLFSRYADKERKVSIVKV